MTQPPRRHALHPTIAALLLAACGHGPGATAAAAPSPTPTSTPRPKGKPSGVPATEGVVVQAGDSIGKGDGAEGNWAAIEHLGLPKGIKIFNPSTNGIWMMSNLGQRGVDVFPHHDPKHASVLVIESGSNDLAGGNTADFLYQNVTRIFTQRAQNAGWYVIVDTILPRGDAGWNVDQSREEQRVAYNKLVRANSAGADAVNDLAGDPVIGDAVDPGTSKLFGDKTHPTKAGQERIAKIEAKTIATMLEYPPRAPDANAPQ